MTPVPAGGSGGSPPQDVTAGGLGGSPPQDVTAGGLGGSATPPSAAFEDAVVVVVRAIPWGEVMTYGEVAEHAGFPGRARGVGRILAISAEEMPWWRVVAAGSRLVSPASEHQRRRLEEEGWVVSGSRLASPHR